jgi:hypothetical protein
MDARTSAWTEAPIKRKLGECCTSSDAEPIYHVRDMVYINSKMAGMAWGIGQVQQVQRIKDGEVRIRRFGRVADLAKRAKVSSAGLEVSLALQLTL